MDHVVYDAVSTAVLSWTNSTTQVVPVQLFLDHGFIARYISVTLSILGLVGTSVVLLALGKLRGKFSPHMLIIISLTVSDLMVCLLVIANRLDHDALNNVLYNIVKSNGCYRNIVYGKGVRVCTFLNLMAMAFDHYLAILKPLQYRNLLTRQRTIILIVFIWVFSGVIHYTQFYVTLSYLEPGDIFCITYANVHRSFPLVEYIYISIIAIGIIYMTYVYIRVFVEARKCLQYSTRLNRSNKNNMKQDWYAAITSILILGTFLFCYIPYTVSNTLRHIPALKHHLHYISSIHPYMASLRVLNSVCDPVIYALRLSKVRQGLRLVQQCVCLRHAQHQQAVQMVNTNSMSTSCGDKTHDTAV